MKNILTSKDFHNQDMINENIIFDKIKDIWDKFSLPKTDEKEIEDSLNKMTEDEKISYIKNGIKDLEDCTLSKTLNDLMGSIKSSSILTKMVITIAIALTIQSCGTSRWTPACHKKWKIDSREYSNKYPSRNYRR
jgi:hypothetical protein